MEARGQPQVSLRCHLFCLFDTGPLTGLGGWPEDWGIHLFPHLQRWEYKCALPCLALYTWVLEIKPSPLCLPDRQFTDWANTPVLCVNFYKQWHPTWGLLPVPIVVRKRLPLWMQQDSTPLPDEDLVITFRILFQCSVLGPLPWLLSRPSQPHSIFTVFTTDWDFTFICINIWWAVVFYGDNALVSFVCHLLPRTRVKTGSEWSGP